jgi:hypothetical protein
VKSRSAVCGLSTTVLVPAFGLTILGIAAMLYLGGVRAPTADDGTTPSKGATGESEKHTPESAPARAPTTSRSYEPAALTFDGQSAALRNTVIVPTLDTPVPAGKNVIWCASFELAWQHLQTDVVHGPLQVAGAADVAARLNSSAVNERDFAPGACVALAGRRADGICDRIVREMAERYPKQPPPELDPNAELVAFAYLQAAARFTLPFFDNDAEFVFRDAAGEKTAVESFGIRPHDDYAYRKLREQVEVLYNRVADSPREGYVDGHEVYPEFALDLCRTSQPYQLVLAVVPPQQTLGATLDRLTTSTATSKPTLRGKFGARDVLLVPEMAWRITHRFRELEGPDRGLLNPGFEALHIDTAAQTLEFRLDRSGAELASEAKVYVKPMAVWYTFDRPFLLYLQRRGADRPLLVMWIDNAELLTRAAPSQEGT